MSNMSNVIERGNDMDNYIRPLNLLELSRLCLKKNLSNQQLVEIMEPIREEKNPATREQIAQRLIEEVKKL